MSYYTTRIDWHNYQIVCIFSNILVKLSCESKTLTKVKRNLEQIITKPYEAKFSTLEYIKAITKKRKPDFDNVIKVINQETPPRPSIMELTLDNIVIEEVLLKKAPKIHGI